MLNFIRSDIVQLSAYHPHPGGSSGEPVKADIPLDRLDSNESPFDLPSDLKEKLAWTYQQIIENNRYPDAAQQALKSAIAEYINESTPEFGQPSVNPGITPANISLGNGSDEIIRAILIATCVGGEGSVLVANPTFSIYAILAQTLAIPVVKVDRIETNFEIDLEAAQKAIEQTQPPIRVVFVVHPNSPTANALTPRELEWLRSLPEHILVVIDEAYFEFSQTTLAGELPSRPNWMILRTFSKAFGLAAHRVGYSLAHPQLTAALEKVRLPYNLPSFSQAAALVAITNRQQLLSTIPKILAEREQLIHNLSQHPALKVWPSAANFIYLRLNTSDENSKEAKLTQLAQQLKAQGTLVRQIAGGLRITVGTPEENMRSHIRIQAALANQEVSA